MARQELYTVNISKEHHNKLTEHAEKTGLTIRKINELTIELYFETSVDRFKRVKEENGNKLPED